MSIDNYNFEEFNDQLAYLVNSGKINHLNSTNTNRGWNKAINEAVTKKHHPTD